MLRKYNSTVLGLLQTDLISPQTKKLLNERLEEINKKYKPVFFSADVFEQLQAIANRLIPQHDKTKYIDLAASIDRRLSEGKNDGWRFASMPPDGEAYLIGLKAVNEMSILTFRKFFVQLDALEQDDILSAVQNGDVSG